jgi:hypothetical protein
MFPLQALGAVAQPEWALIAERTKAGPRAAAAGSAAILACAPAPLTLFVRSVRASRDAAHLDSILAQVDAWLPTVLNRTPESTWTVERMRRIVTESVFRAIGSRMAAGWSEECQPLRPGWRTCAIRAFRVVCGR